MKKDSIFEENTLMEILIKSLIYMFKWLSFCIFVFIGGLTVCLFVMYVIRGNDLPNTVMAKIFSYITMYDFDTSLDLIDSFGKLKVVVAGCGYGFGVSLTYLLIYMVVSKFIAIFNSIVRDNMFTKENLKLINEALPLSLFIAFLLPIIIFCANYSTGIFDYTQINMGGIIYICVAYILKVIFTKGYDLQKRNLKYSKEIAEVKIRENEKKVAKIKEEAKEKKQKATKKKKTTDK